MFDVSGRRVRGVQALVAAIGILVLADVVTQASPTTSAVGAVSRSGPADLDVTIAMTVGSPVIVGDGTVTGRIEVALRRADGSTIATGFTSTSAGGTWRVTLRDSDGVFFGLSPGQLVLVKTLEGEIRVNVADVRLYIDRTSDSGFARTEPGSGVRLLVGAGEAVQAEGVADADGRFGFDFPDGSGVQGRAPVTITLTTDDGNRTTSTRPVPYVVLSLHPGDINGGMRPGSPVRVALFDADGKYVAGGRSVADDQGRFSTWLRTSQGHMVRARPGQVLHVADSDQELVLEAPGLTGEYDLEHNLLHGSGVPGAGIGLVVWNPYFPDYAEPETTVDASGTWSLDPGIAIYPGSHFYVTQRLPEGDEIFYCLQIPALHVQPGSPVVTVEALWDVDAQLSLERASGVVAAASGAATYEGRVQLTLADTSGNPVAVEPGDRLLAHLDGVTRTLEVGVLTAGLSADGMLTGAAAPGTEVIFDSRKPLETAIAGQDGAFSFEATELTTGGWARSGESFEVYSLAETSDHLRVRFQGPALMVTLEGAVVSGSAMPSVPFVLQRAAASTGTDDVDGWTRADGSFEVVLARPIAAGDTVTVRTGPVSTTLSVAAITAAFDDATGVLSGMGPPFEVLDVDAYIGQGSFPERLFSTTGEDGRWSLDLRARGRGQPVVNTDDIRRFEIRYRQNANIVVTHLAGPFATTRRLHLPAALDRP